MSSSLRVYAVRLSDLARVIGSRDEEIRQRVEEKHGSYMDDDEHPKNRESSDEALTLREALGQVLTYDHTQLSNVFAGPHQFVFEYLADVLGEELDHWCDQGSKGYHMELAGNYLREKGLDEIASLTRLINGPPPLGLPTLKRGIGFGYVGVDSARTALKRIRPLNIMGLERDIAYYLVRFYVWLEKADIEGKDLVGFYW